MKKNQILAIIVLLIASTFPTQAGKRQPDIKITITPDHADWVYKPGEHPQFRILVLQDSAILSNVTLKYSIGPEMLNPTISDSLLLSNGTCTIDGGTLKVPGFIRCKVTCVLNNKTITGLAAAAFSPEQIKPTAKRPADFDQFWSKAIRETARIPLDTQLTLLPQYCTAKVNVYQVSFQNNSYKSRIYGILCMPKQAGKYPAILRVPGAGVRPYKGNPALAEKGFVVLDIGIHGIPVTMEQSVYDDLAKGALDNYWFSSLDDRDHYYYKRVYLGCIRAVDFLSSLQQVDTARIAVTGGSQGGALTIVTAALDHRIKYLAAFYPALCDLTGYLSGRAGGWPHMFNAKNSAFNIKKDKIKTAGYYDVVNFAKSIKVPGYYSWGYNDMTCPPTSTYAAYNVIDAPKSLLIVKETGHFTVPEQSKQVEQWLIDQLNK